MNRRNILRFLPAAAFVSLVSMAAGPADKPMPSVFWEPYAPDPETLVLCHFDRRTQTTIGEALAGLELGDDGSADGLSALLPHHDREQRATPNDTLMQSGTIALHGACQEVEEGRFGGSLRLSGQDGCLRLPAGGFPGAWTIEAWFKAPQLPNAKATLFEVRGMDRPLRISLAADGRIEVQWPDEAGPSRSSWRCAPGAWFHVVFRIQGSAANSSHKDTAMIKRMDILVNGRVVMAKDRAENPLPAYATFPPIIVGNDATGESGFDGLLDELRFSSTWREYFKADLDWVDAEGVRPGPPGLPLFREDNLLFWLTFDNTLLPVRDVWNTRLGKDTPTDAAALAEENPGRWRFRYGDGVSRQGLLLREKGRSIVYEGLRLSPKGGAIAFWSRPRDWDNSVSGPNDILGPIFEITDEHNRRIMSVAWLRTPPDRAFALEPGKWTHVVLEWWNVKKEERHHHPVRVYLNGKPHRSYVLDWRMEGGNFLGAREQRLVISTPLSGKQVEHEVYLDDLRIYRHHLSPTEIHNLLTLYDRRKETRTLPKVDIVYNLNGLTGDVKLKLFPLHPDTAGAKTARVEFAAKGAKVPLATQDVEISAEPPTEVHLHPGPFAFGEYETRCEVRDAQGKALVTETSSYTRKPPPWWGNRIGLSDKVMPGWTPIQAKGKTLSVILRDIRFSDAGLPESVVSVGKEILAGPVSFLARVDGKDVPLAPVAGSFQTTVRDETRADFSGKAEGGGVTAAIRGYLEFDGMMWFSVTLSGTGRPEALQLRVPYQEDASRLMHRWTGGAGFRNSRDVRIGATPAGEGQIFSSLDNEDVVLYRNLKGSFIPYVMLTGDRRGMAWFAENDRGWTYSMETPAVAIERQGATVTLVLNILSEPVSLAEARTIEFGLHPIPVKKLQPGWRMTPNWGVYPDSFGGYNMKGGLNRAETQFNRHPRDWDEAAGRFRIGDGFEKGGANAFRREYGRDPQPHEAMVAGLYHTLIYVGGEFPEHTREWGEIFHASRYTPENLNYFAWILDEWVKRGLARGIYFDECWNSFRDSLLSPVAYVRPDGGVQPGVQWRTLREHMRRTRQIFVDHGLRPHLCAHTTHTPFIPCHSFFDVLLDGEDHFTGPGHNSDFMDHWPPDRLRFNHGEKWGLVPTWLDWTSADYAEAWGPYRALRWRRTRAYTAALLVHDLVWTVPYLGTRHDIDHAWIRESRIRLEPDTDFVAYWEPETPATHTHPELYVSIWKRPGWSVVALANWGNERLEAEVTLDLAAMGFADVDAGDVSIRDVDKNLLTYLPEDFAREQEKPPTVEAMQEMAGADGENAGPAETLVERILNLPAEGDRWLRDLTLEEKPTEDERRAGARAADPDGSFEWRDGVLRCPVRRHDFRLFEFRREGESHDALDKE